MTDCFNPVSRLIHLKIRLLPWLESQFLSSMQTPGKPRNRKEERQLDRFFQMDDLLDLMVATAEIAPVHAVEVLADNHFESWTGDGDVRWSIAALYRGRSYLVCLQGMLEDLLRLLDGDWIEDTSSRADFRTDLQQIVKYFDGGQNRWKLGGH